MPQLRVVLDTNVLVSGVAYPQSKPGRILVLWYHGSIEVALSRYILEETKRVLPRFPQLHLTGSRINDLVDSLMSAANMVEPDSRLFPELRDGADQQVLGTFVAAKADYLITGDKDLLVLAERYAIVTPAQFLEKHT